MVKWLFAILFIVIGAFLFGLTIDGMGWLGRIIKFMIGMGCFYIAGRIVNGTKTKK